MLELTQAQIDRQDLVDNLCHEFIKRLAEALGITDPRVIAWDIEPISIIRDAAQGVFVDGLEVMTKMEFYPYIDDREECGFCEGAGKVACDMCKGGFVALPNNDRTRCSWCDGTGSVPCGECDGEGKVAAEDAPSKHDDDNVVGKADIMVALGRYFGLDMTVEDYDVIPSELTEDELIVREFVFKHVSDDSIKSASAYVERMRDKWPNNDFQEFTQDWVEGESVMIDAFNRYWNARRKSDGCPVCGGDGFSDESKNCSACNASAV